MITDAILSAFYAVAGWVVGLVPSFDAPSWMTTDVPGYLSTVAGWMGSLSAWLPLSTIPVVLGFAALALTVALAVKLTRIVLSFMTFGGGSAA